MLLIGQEASIAHQPVEQGETQKISKVSKVCPDASGRKTLVRRKCLPAVLSGVPLQCHGHVFVREPEIGQDKALGEA